MLKWIILFLLVCVLCIIEWMRELHTFRVTHYHIASKKLNGLKEERKIVFLSDLHNYSYGVNNEKLIRAIEREKPDYILVAGDMLVAKPGKSTEIAENFMKQLPGISEVYHSNGNHEQRLKESEDIYGELYVKYESSLKDAGVHCLSNERVALSWDNKSLAIYGLELPHKKYKKFRKQVLKVEDVESLLGKAKEDDFNILIAHNPTFMDTYMKWGADVTVSGHLHGGVVRIPFIGGIISPQFILFPKYSGEMKKVGEKFSVVSKGIGIHTIKIRLFNPAEIVVLHINGTEE